MGKFEQYLNDANTSFVNTDWVAFLLNLVVTALLSGALAWFYVKFGNAISNRKRFARNFLPLALTTMLIITIVKSSIALSLGLVGALSIVRFRAAIKDPEELTYLFLTIGIGLAAGAGQVVIAVIAFFAIVAVLFVQAFLSGKVEFRTAENMNLNITTSHKDLKGITKALSEAFSFVELKRVDESKDRLTLAYVIEAKNVDEIESAKTKLLGLSSDMSISFVEQRNIAV